MDFQTYQQLLKDPQFASLSYEEQTSVKQKAVTSILVQDPQFAQLHPQQRSEVFNKFMMQAPVFQDQNMQQMAQYLQDGLMNQDVNKRQEAKEWTDRFLTEKTARENSLIFATFARLKDSTETYPTFEIFKELNGAFKSDEKTKLEKYARSFVEQDSEWKKQRIWGDQVLALGLNLGELVGLTMFGAGTTAAPRALGSAVNWVNKFGRGMMFAKSAIHAGVTTSIGLARDFAMDTVNDAYEEDENFRQTLERFGDRAATYYLWDVLGNAFFDIILPGVLKSGAKVLSVDGFEKHVVRDFQNFSKKILVDGEIPKDILMKADDKTKEWFYTVKRAADIAKKPEIQPEEMLELYALRVNAKLTRSKTGLYTLKKSGKQKSFKTADEAIEYINEIASRPSSEISDAMKLKETFFQKTQPLMKERKLEGTFSIQKPLTEKDMLKDGIILRSLIPEGGELNPEAANMAFDSIAKRINVKANVNIKLLPDTDDFFKLTVNDETIGQIPKVLTAANEDTLISTYRKLFNSLYEQTTGEKDFKRVWKMYRALLMNYDDYAAKNMIFSPRNVKKLLEDIGYRAQGMDDPYDMLAKHIGEWFDSFGNTDDLGRYVFNNYGLVVKKLKEGVSSPTTILRAYDLGSGRYISAKNGQDLIEQLNKVKPIEGVPKAFMPKVVVLENKAMLEYIAPKTMKGNFREVMTNLSMYKNYSKRLKTFQKVGFNEGRFKIESDIENVKFILHDEELKTVAEFSSAEQLTEALKIRNDVANEFDELVKVLKDKGYGVITKNGKYYAYDIHGNPENFIAVDTMEDLKSLSRTSPMPTEAPELSGVDDEIVSSLKEADVSGFHSRPADYEVNSFDKFLTGKFGDKYLDFKTKLKTWYGHYDQFVKPMNGFVQDSVKRYGDKAKGALKFYRNAETALNLMRVEETRMVDQLYNLFYSNGTIMKKSRRRLIQEYMESLNPLEYAKKVGLSDQEIRIADQIIDVYKTLGKEFGIPENINILSYFPHMRDAARLKGKLNYLDGDVDKFLRDAIGEGNTALKDIDAFFMHERLTNLYSFIEGQDALETLLSYTKTGLKKRYLGKIVQDFQELLKEEADNMPDVVKSRLFLYVNQLTGSSHSYMQLVQRHLSSELMGKLIKDQKVGQKVSDTLMASSYLSFMGFKPVLAMRNSLQPWTTLAPKIGNHWVAEAYKNIMNNKAYAQEIYDYLRSVGTVTDSMPLFGGEAFKGQGIIHSLSRWGLAWFRNSDVLTRMVAFDAATSAFDDAFKMFKGKQISFREFLSKSGIKFIDDDIQMTIRNMMMKGNIDEAKKLYGLTQISDTMFNYWKGQSSALFHGTFGRLFGMMGTYPVFFVENMRKTLSKASTFEKIAIGSTYIANSMILYESFNRVLGVNVQSFLPWSPMIFTGGPLYQELNSVLLSMGPGYRGRQSRAQALGIKEKDGKWTFNPLDAGIAKATIPLLLVGHNIVKGLQAADDGDYLKALYNFTSSPPSPDYIDSLIAQF